MVMCVDLWQLQPVGGTWLCCNPLHIPAGRAQDALWMLWGAGPDTVRSFWSLTQLVRCNDVWYNSFLEECRNGALSVDSYFYFHGLPTFVSPATTCACNDDALLHPILAKVKTSWATAFLAGCSDMGALILRTECAACKARREARHRVLTDSTHIPTELRESPFTEAPAIYSFNVPRYYSLQLRAREYSKQKRQQ